MGQLLFLLPWVSGLVCCLAPDCLGQATKMDPPAIVGPMRQMEDYGYLNDSSIRRGLWWEPAKYIPVTRAPNAAFGTVGGELRLRYERIGNSDFGAPPQDNGGYLLTRVLPYVSFTVPDVADGIRLQLFGQVESAFSTGDARGPSPVDEEDFGLLQGFAQIAFAVGDGELSLQGGRQVISFGTERLLGSRYGTNILLSFDGGRVRWKNGQWDLRGFYLLPVQVDPEPFDDLSSSDQQLWGIYGTRILTDWMPSLKNASVDFYYLGYSDANASYNSGSGRELRHTWGTRLFGNQPMGKGFLDWNDEVIFQFGSFDNQLGDGNILAWSVGTETGYTFDMAMAPRVFVRANYVSGDENRNSANLQTFNPLFPKGKYFGELTPVGPYNLINLQGGLSLNLTDTITLSFQGGPYWRASTQDAVYGVGGNIVRPENGISNARFIGGQMEWVAEWKPRRELSFLVSYSQFIPGAFIDDTGPAKTTHFAALEAVFQF